MIPHDKQENPSPAFPQPAMLLPAGEVHVWRAVLDRSQASSFEPLLSPDELSRAGRYRSRINSDFCKVSRGLLRTMIGAYLAIPPAEVGFDSGPRGKPILARGGTAPDLRFNVSHSGAMAIYAFSIEADVGIDLELIDPKIDAAGLALQLFSSPTLNRLRELPAEQQRVAFFRLWTRFEALAKAAGIGLELLNKNVEIDSDQIEIAGPEPSAPATRWIISDLEIAHGYKAALASPAPAQSIILRDWS